ncbi:DUF4097 family beta strand repeat-containing protein [Shewanella sp. A14]
MNVIKYILIAPLMALSAFAMAIAPVEQQQNVAENPNVSVKVQRGNIQLISWDNNSIQIKGQLDELSQGLLFEVKGNTVVIEDKLPRSYQGNNQQGSQLTIYLPKQLTLDAEGVSAHYKLSQLNGQVALALVSGSIKANNIVGETTLTTVSGNIISTELNGKINLETVSGNITDNNSQGDAELRLVSGQLNSNSAFNRLTIDQVSGNINASMPMVTELNVVTISGDAKLTLGADITKARLESISGDITLTFSAEPNLSFMIDGGPGGIINNQLTDDKPIKQKYSPVKNLQFNTQSGAGKMNINTISGRINLTQ